MGVSVTDGVRWIQVNDGIVVFVPESAQFVDLNESASELWGVLGRGGWKPNVAVEYLTTEYAMDTDVALTTVESFLVELEHRSVISRAV